MSDIFTLGFTYKNFEVIKVFDVSDYHSKAVHLRHRITGLEVVHLFNEDEENLFAFAFRTPNKTSNGAAHIIEHSVLCGSEKFPLKDPFVSLANQSVKTYLNAMTYPDKTVYPASSIAKNDYFNLMNVYGDAVFFPKLRREIFMQEAHRLEVDENNDVTIQGVVYNEMKGNYSSFDSVANDAIAMSLLKGSVYEKDSGGDPVEIPTITYEDFKNFHQKWYRPDNCLVFLYGNISTEEQLDFLNENFIGRLEEKYKKNQVDSASQQKNIEEFLSYVKSDVLKEPVFNRYEGPAGDGESKSTVLVSWKIGNVKDSFELTENAVLAGILANHDGSPLQKALMDSGLGEDIAPQVGFSTSFYENLITLGLRGVKEKDAKKVEKVLLDTISSVVKNGVSKKDIEATMMAMDISHREIKRGSGPFSIVLMNRVVTGWLYGYDVSSQIRSRKDLEAVKQNIKNKPGYLENLISQKLLDNRERALSVIVPSKAYAENREKIEKELIKNLMKSSSLEEIKRQNDALHNFQQLEEDDSCLPHLKPQDFIKDGRPLMNKSRISMEEIESAEGSKLPLLLTEDNTNGITYFCLGFPVDTLSCKDYPWLPVFSDTVTECGWKGMDWAKTAEETALHTGGLGAQLLTMDGPVTEKSKEFCAEHKWTNRDWLVFRVTMIEEESENALNLLSDCLTGTDFSDLKRIRDIVNETKNDIEASVIPDGHIYVSCRACSSNSKKSAIDEIFNGLTQLSSLKKIAAKSDSELSRSFNELWKKIKGSGAFLHVTAEKTGLEKIKSLLPAFIKKAEIGSLKEAENNTKEDFISVINNEFDSSSSNGSEYFAVESQVGFASQTIPAAPYGTKDCAADEVCSHWLSNNMLWEKVRTIGGAYGSFCNTETFTELMVFATYRDPNALESAEVFKKCIEECAEMDFSDDEIEKAVMGCYSHFIQPQTPRGRGASSLTRTLYGILDEDREQKIKWLLEVSAEDVKKAFKRLLEQMKNDKFAEKMRQTVIGSKKSIAEAQKKGKIGGKIQELSL